MRVKALLSAAYRPRTHGSSRTSILWNLGSVYGTSYSIGYWCRASFRKPVPWWQWRRSHAELQSLPFLPARLAEIVEQGKTGAWSRKNVPWLKRSGRLRPLAERPGRLQLERASDRKE